MGTSKLQDETGRRVRALLKGYKVRENYRPKWLRNPETGIPLEIDLYLPEIKLGIEVQGRQHTQFIPYFHKSTEDFESQRRRDQIKRQMCEAQGVTLYEIFHNDDIDAFIESLKNDHEDMWLKLTARNLEIKRLPYYAARLHKARSGGQMGVVHKYAQKIIAIAEEYGIPLETIKPDFSVKKIEAMYPNMPIVHISRPSDKPERRLSRPGALRSVTPEGVARVISAYDGTADVIKEFDATTGEAKDGSTWSLHLDSMPKEYTSSRAYHTKAHDLQIGQQVTFCKTEDKRQVATVLEIHTDAALVELLGEDGKYHKRFADFKYIAIE